MDKQVPFFCYTLTNKNAIESYSVENSAGEVIQNPVFIGATPQQNTPNIGIMVPYGGYINIKMTSAYKLQIRVQGNETIISTLQPSSTSKIKIVFPMVCTMVEAAKTQEA